jgi:hypothetical protein
VATGGRAYAVHDADASSGEVTRLYPYTLQGLTDALEEARFRSFGGQPQVVAVVSEGRSKVIRRYERGHEVPPD